MLPRRNRLSRKNDLAKICRQKKSIKQGCLLLKYRENELTAVRMAFVVARKVAIRASKRNLIKRRLRNAAQSLLNRCKTGIDIVFFALAGIEKKNFAEIKKNLKEILFQAGVLNK